MLKKISLIIVFILLLSVNIYGQNSKNTDVEITGTFEEKLFGSFVIPKNWVMVDLWSNENKIFYVHKKSIYSKTPTNISIEQGNNPYSIDEHTQFRYAIMSQLSKQMQDSESSIAGSGSFTKNNDLLYIFTLDELDEVKTIQFYIIGEKKHILIHVTEFYNDVTDVKKIAQSIADSFKWANN